MAEEPLPPKVHWHPCSLQQLTPNVLTTVVNRILEGSMTLLPIVPEHNDESPHAHLDKRDKRTEAVRRHLESFGAAHEKPQYH